MFHHVKRLGSKDAKSAKEKETNVTEKFEKRKIDRGENFDYAKYTGGCLYYKIAVFSVNFNLQTW
jgi:hypothetical protein